MMKYFPDRICTPIVFLGIMLLVILNPGEQAAAQPYSATLTFYEGLDVDTGDTMTNPAVASLVLCHPNPGGTPGDPPIDRDLFDFPESIDLYSAYHHLGPEQTVYLVPGSTVPVIVFTGMPFEQVTTEMLDAASWQMVEAVEIHPGDTVVLRSSLGTLYKLIYTPVLSPSPAHPDTIPELQITYTPVFSTVPTPIPPTPTPSSAIPEPASGWLLLLGLLGILGLIGARLLLRQKLRGSLSRAMSRDQEQAGMPALSGQPHHRGETSTRPRRWWLLLLVLVGLMTVSSGDNAAQDSCRLTVEIRGNGRVTGRGIDCDSACAIDPLPGGAGVSPGDALNLKAIPAPGFRFVGWLLDGVPYSGITRLTGDTVLTAIFETTLDPFDDVVEVLGCSVDNRIDVLANDLTDSPAEIPDLVLWLDATETHTLDLTPGTDQVSRWQDKSGHDHHATALSGAQPHYVPGAIGGRAALHFDGNDLFQGADGLITPGASPITVCAVAAYDGFPYPGPTVFQVGDPSQQLSVYSMTVNVSGRMVLDIGSFWIVATGGTLSQGIPSLLTWQATGEAIHEPGAVRLFRDGQELPTSAWGTVPPTLDPQQGYRIGGGGPLSGGPFVGDLAEVLVYARALSDTERQQVERMLTRKYWGQMQITAVSDPAHGVATTDGHAVSYTPDCDFLGEDTFSYTVTDDQGETYTATVLVTVAGTTRLAADDQVTVTIGSSDTQIDVLANDYVEPPSAVADLGLWLDATDPTTLDLDPESGSVRHWRDKSGHEHHAASARTARPVLVPQSIGGKPALCFDGDDFIGGASGILDPGAAPMTVFSVVRIDNTVTPSYAGGPVLLQIGDQSLSLQDYRLGVRYATLSLNNIDPEVLGEYQQSGNRITPQVPSLLTWRATGEAFEVPGAVRLFKNGAELTTIIGPFGHLTPDIAPVRYRLGADLSGNQGLVGDLAEVLVYTRVLSEDERRQVEQYLLRKYWQPDTEQIIDVSAPVHGAASTDGQDVSYTPDPWFEGQDAFTYTIQDQDGRTSTATVTVSVACVPPIAVDDSATVAVDSQDNRLAVLLNDGRAFDRPAPGMLLWLDAAASETLERRPGTQYVTRWRDKSGHGYEALQALEWAQPLFYAAGPGGRPALRFDGEDDRLTLPERLADGTMTILVVYQPDEPHQLTRAGVTYGNRWLLWGPYRDLMVSAGTNGLAVYYNGGNPWSSPVLARYDGSVGHAWVLAEIETDSRQTRLLLNGLVRDTGLWEGNAPDHRSPTVIGDTFPGAIAEILLYDQLLSDRDRQQVEHYLTAKYGIPYDGTALTLVEVPETSAAGGDVQTDADAALYTPPAGFVGPDRFLYRVSDGLDQDLGAVTVTVSDSHHWIESSAGDGGQIVPSGTITVPEGGAQGFTIIPDPGYRIKDVLVDAASVGIVETYLFDPVTTDHTIEAIFSKQIDDLMIVKKNSVRNRIEPLTNDALVPPDQPPAGLWIHLEAGTLAFQLQDGEPVTIWEDQSGRQPFNDALQSIPDFQPLFLAEGLNGYPAVVFDGVNDALHWQIQQPVEFTVLAVCQPERTIELPAAETPDGNASVAEPNLLLDTSYVEPGGGWSTRAGLSVGTNGMAAYEGGHMHWPALAVYEGPVGTDAVLVGMHYQDRQPSLFVNGALARIGVQGLGAQFSQGLGAQNGSFKGAVAELLVYDTVLPVCTRRQAEAYLAATYGLTLSPPELSISQYEETSDQGGTVTAEGLTLFYTPPPDYVGPDRFTYTLSDGCQTDTASVEILVIEADHYVIQADAGGGGTILPPGAITITPGADQTFTIAPDDGYQIADVIVNDVSGGPVSAYTFTTVMADQTIEAVFDSLSDITWDFETGDLSGWTPTGQACANQPVFGVLSRTFTSGNPGYQGDYWVSTCKGENCQEPATGTLISKPFEISSPYITFLLGGSSERYVSVPHQSVDLLINGAVVRQAVPAQEQMLRVSWDVAEYVDQMARIRVADRAMPWGQANPVASPAPEGYLHVDDVRFETTNPLQAMVKKDAYHDWTQALSTLRRDIFHVGSFSGGGPVGDDTYLVSEGPQGFARRYTHGEYAIPPYPGTYTLRVQDQGREQTILIAVGDRLSLPLIDYRRNAETGQLEVAALVPGKGRGEVLASFAGPSTGSGQTEVYPLAVDPAVLEAYALTQEGSVSVLHTVNLLTRTHTEKSLEGPVIGGIDLYTGYTLIGWRQNGGTVELVSINTQTGTVEPFVTTGAATVRPEAFCVTRAQLDVYPTYPDNEKTYFMDQAGQLYVVDLHTLEVTTQTFANEMADGVVGFDAYNVDKQGDTLIAYRYQGEDEIELLLLNVTAGNGELLGILKAEQISGVTVDSTRQYVYLIEERAAGPVVHMYDLMRRKLR